jgi:hypothetical protein
MKIFRKARFARKKKSAACHGRPRPEKYVHDLVAIVIVIIPIAIGMPPAAVFVPPAMILIPAVFASFMQVVPRMVGLPAVPAVALHGFMQFVIRFGDASLALVEIIGGRPGCSHECQHAGECYGS